MSFYHKDDVRKAAEGKWLFVLHHLAPELEQALQRLGRHVPDPVHGGKDGFRLFKDCAVTGGAYSNKGGQKADGFELLMWLKGWQFPECVRNVGELVQAPMRSTGSSTAGSDRHTKSEAVSIVGNGEDKVMAIGRYISTKQAPFHDEPKGRLTTVVEIRGRAGKSWKFWGNGFRDALDGASAQPGDLVEIRSMGIEKVSFRNESGSWVSKNRTRWKVTVIASRKSSVKDDSDDEPFEQLACSPESPPEVDQSSAISDGLRERAPDWLVKVSDGVKHIEARERATESGPNPRAIQLFKSCVRLNSDAACIGRSYLSRRGVLSRLPEVIRADNVRFHPAVEYYDESRKMIGKFPALVCAIRNLNGDIVNVHRTYLSRSGLKASVPEPRKAMAMPNGNTMSGCAIHLAEPVDGVLSVAEGVETAWSVFRASGFATWSTVSAQMMRDLVLPDHVHTLFVWGDRDRSGDGQSAAAELAATAREKGIRAVVLLPRFTIPALAKSLDWNDVLLDQGLFGFPSRSELVKRSVALAA